MFKKGIIHYQFQCVVKTVINYNINRCNYSNSEFNGVFLSTVL